jgi:hypothetical protein
MNELRPEATYFYAEDGKRVCLFIFDMQDPSQLPPAVEPFFQNSEASVRVTPVTNGDDLQRGLQQVFR